MLHCTITTIFNAMKPPTTLPAESVRISPEHLQIADCYLHTQSIQNTAQALELGTELVADVLQLPQVRSYIDQVFRDAGFNNRYKLRAALDAVIAKKFQDMELSETGSNKDIADLLALSHKFTMDQLQLELEFLKLQQREHNIKNQVNVQINDTGGSNYQQLINRLLDADNKS
jgi:hypothetical protein